ncbi:MAG: GNAT family N-acetyltransferase [Actinophytocola sp.]|uniref:GNAT family N-acetyltransferase n=1 Tax=Actinophytocola sp. TaxID=1872138 RepID=UPI0013227FBD|nr:GNAT family N-acetyltransferase [Actinophytocola sp.]MPZ78978.1 GNAT family N-acetyltransferase [Actinophytocola sp.]
MTTRPLRNGEPPEGYPVAFERWLRLRDGRYVWVRPILPSDAPELAEAIRTADPDTLRRRFLGSPPRLTPKLLRWLTTVDYERRLALVALDPATGRGIAIARFEPLQEEGVAEIAVAVDPAWRRVGLATMLVELLAEAALERGFHSFGASYLAQNRPIEAMLTHAGGGAKLLISHGVAELAVDLDHERTIRAGGHH